MACKCFEETKSLFQKRITQKLQGEIAEVIKAGFAHSLWYSGRGDYSPVSLSYQCRYYRRRSNGEPELLQTKADHSATLNYCPFCGTKSEGKETQ